MVHRQRFALDYVRVPSSANRVRHEAAGQSAPCRMTHPVEPHVNSLVPLSQSSLPPTSKRAIAAFATYLSLFHREHVNTLFSWCRATSEEYSSS